MMKKILSTLIAMLLLVSAIPALSDTPVTISLDGKALESPIEPVNVDGNIMVPFRTIFEALGMDINWSEVHQKALAQSNDKTIILSIGSDKMLVNTNVITLPVAPFIHNGSTLVPVRAVSEAMECTVSWNDAEKKVVLKTKNYVEPDISGEPNPGGADTEIKSDAAQNQPGESENQFIPVIDDTPAYINKNNSSAGKELMELINSKRIEFGIPALSVDENVCAIALAHSRDMAEYGYFNHTTPANLTPFDRLDLGGIYYTIAAENLASGFLTAEDVLDSWMNSPAHREILLRSEFSHFGVGYHAGGPNGTYWTLMLIKR